MTENLSRIGRLMDAVAHRRAHGPPLSEADEETIDMLVDILTGTEPEDAA